MKNNLKRTHKYKQFVEYIINLINTKQLVIGEQLPSVNIFSKTLIMSKDTIMKGISKLLERGIIEAVNRIGYFVKKVDILYEHRIFLLFDEFTAYRQDLYNSLRDNFKDFADFDVFFHHNNLNNFKKLITENRHNYTHYVIITYLEENVSHIINQIPTENKIILDYVEVGIKGNFGAVYQDFENDLYNSLVSLKSNLKKYKRIVMIYNTDMKHDELRKKGCKRFCKENGFKMLIIKTFNRSDFKIGDFYITIEKFDIEVVAVIKAARANSWTLGKEVGLLSFDDTVVKEVLEGGITVISSDFKQMGKTAAEMIKEDKLSKHQNPLKVILRKSV